MKNIYRLGKAIGGVSALMLVSSMSAQTPAFPGAEGFGMYTTGGRGGTVYHVTKLTDDGSDGTLRWAVNKKGKRTIVFDVSGIIELQSKLSISNGDITIAGQTAPGDGICLKNYELYFNANNVIVRFIRCRMGTDKPDSNGTLDRDATWGRRKSDIIIDHCSMSWCTDECASFYDNTNFTMQWCMIAESLRGSLHPKGYHGYGGIWGGKGASFHHNMLANHDSRNPRLCGSRYSNLPDQEIVDLRNNVIYNWGATNSGYAGEGGSYNFVNNYYKSGPATGWNIKYRIFEPYADDGSNNQPYGTYGHFYLSGNYMSEKGQNWDWQGININNGNNSSMNEWSIRSNTEFQVQRVTTHTAEVAFEKVCKLAGASYSRDAVDERIANEAKTGRNTYTGSVLGGKGIIDKVSDVGGYPTYNSLPQRTDTDGDGIPDDWEDEHGLNKNNYDDGATLAPDGSGYTWLEIYMNSLVCHIMEEGLSDGINSLPFNCNADIKLELDSAKIVKHGSGSSRQTVKKGDEIVPFYYNWSGSGVETVTVEGMPESVNINIDNNNKKVSFDGAVTAEAGEYPFTITAKGDVNDAVIGGVITVIDSAKIVLCGEGEPEQTVEKGDSITPLCYEWSGADSVKIVGIPENLTINVDKADKRISIDGIVMADAGDYPFTISTIGGAVNDTTSTGIITVSDHSGLKSATIDKQVVINKDSETIYIVVNGLNGNIETELYSSVMQSLYSSKNTVSDNDIIKIPAPKASGVYVVVLKTENGKTYTEKLIIQK